MKCIGTAGHPLPSGEGWEQTWLTALSLGERVASVASRVRGFFQSSLATSEFGIKDAAKAAGPESGSCATFASVESLGSVALERYGGKMLPKEVVGAPRFELGTSWSRTNP